MGKNKIILLFFIVFLFFSNKIYGQQANSDNSVQISTERGSCVAQFKEGGMDIGKIMDDEDMYGELTDKELDSIATYFSCRASLDGNISACDKLGQIQGRCAAPFKTWDDFYVKLLTAKSFTPELNRNCRASGSSFSYGKNIDQECPGFIKAFIKGDQEACDSLFASYDNRVIRNCKALISLDDNVAPAGPNDTTKDIVISLKAVKTNNPKLCNKINNDTLKFKCIAYLLGDDNSCAFKDIDSIINKHFCK